MSLVSKVLVVLNALAAIVFLVIAGMDYSARNAWALANFRHELALHGLPLDDKDASWRPGVPIVRDLRPKLLESMFQPTGQAPVATQRKAVEMAKEAAIEFVNSASDEKKQREAIAAVLLPLETNGYRRQLLLEKIKTEKLDTLRGYVGGPFDDVIGVIDSGVDPTTKRARTADLLYNFNPYADPKRREWAQTVVGLEQYVLASARTADYLFLIAQRLQQIIQDESGNFSRQFQELIPRLQLLNEQLKADAARLEQHKKTLEQNNLLYTARRSERDELIDELRKLHELAAAETANLLTVQKQLFDLQREIAEARVANDRLESQIRAKEVGK